MLSHCIQPIRKWQNRLSRLNVREVGLLENQLLNEFFVNMRKLQHAEILDQDHEVVTLDRLKEVDYQ